MISVTPFLILAAATAPLRNPFWPIGHAGAPEVITDEVRVVIQAPVQKEEEQPVVQPEPEQKEVTPSDDELWKNARKSLKFGGKMKVGNKYAVTINGKIYKDGNFVSVTVDEKRFTWRIEVSDNGSLHLRRIRMRDK